jgi:hypothetical protein
MRISFVLSRFPFYYEKIIQTDKFYVGVCRHSSVNLVMVTVILYSVTQM